MKFALKTWRISPAAELCDFDRLIERQLHHHLSRHFCRPFTRTLHFPSTPSRKRNNAIASRRYGELLSATTHEIHSDSSSLFITRVIILISRSGEMPPREGLRPTLAFNRRAYLNEKGLLALLFPRSTTVRRFCPPSRPRVRGTCDIGRRIFVRTHGGGDRGGRAVFY